MKKLLLIISVLCFFPWPVMAQTKDTLYLGFEEYLQLVKAYHPIVKQAKLIDETAKAKLRKARGSFDPKIEGSLAKKQYKDQKYYELLNTSFKIPTWFGVELKASYDKNSGVYLNPQNTLPDDGMITAGIAIPIGQDLLINERTTTLKQAKLYQEQAKFDQDIAINEILFNAAITYFNWLQTYTEVKIFKSFTKNAEVRLKGVVQSYNAGDKPAIDTVEAGISHQKRLLELEQANLNLKKASLKLSGFLWAEENTPIELKENIYPTKVSHDQLEEVLETNQVLQSENIENHPKIKSLGLKIESLEYERRLKLNKLLPDIDLQYNFLNGSNQWDYFINDNYKIGVQVSVPLFLRKERGELELAKLKKANAKFDLINTEIILENKIKSILIEINTLKKQIEQMQLLVKSHQTMVNAENRKFELGGSSLFLINTRENNLIEANMKQIQLNNKLLKLQAELFRVWAIIPQFTQG